MGFVLDKKKSWRRHVVAGGETEWHRCLSRNKPEEAVTSFGSSLWAGESTGHIAAACWSYSDTKPKLYLAFCFRIMKQEFYIVGGFRNWYSVDFSN
jgi:hypothetical protein